MVGRDAPADPGERLRAAIEAGGAALMAAAELLERDGRDVQDIEFTVENGTLWDVRPLR